ncbi:Glutamine amidotransferase type-1 domain-containing protein [Mycena chlorophos]|uniref:Glutamine amidotransferase type-1 domain-containing protein n=1 Tax=Mycena chlorophos TaxID=658473 RepID=A0A8H6TBJ0_MYCCL|nr:Glutamine amidotransferase type-1 domain-containing protein [Mycena chlorophos]
MPARPLILLVCDTPPAQVVSAHGEYPRIFTDLLRSSARQLAIPEEEITLDAYDVTALAYPTDDALEACGGIIYTGSKASAYESIEWITKLVAFTTRVAAEKPHIKLIGICFGHQIIARALGGRCVKNEGKWEVGPTPIELTSLGREVFGTDKLSIQEMHQDHVPEVPPEFHLLGSTSVSMNQGMVRFANGAPPSSPVSLGDIHVFAVQGHPEFTEPIVSKLVELRGKSGVLNAEVVADATRRANWPDDGVSVIGPTILRILGVAK